MFPAQTGPFSLQEGNNWLEERGIPLSALTAREERDQSVKCPAEAGRRESKFSCSLLGAPEVCGCWGSCSRHCTAWKLNLHPKAAGVTGEQCTALVFPDTSPTSSGLPDFCGTFAGYLKKNVCSTYMGRERVCVPCGVCSLHSEVKQKPG